MLARKFSSGQTPFPQMRWVSGSHLCGNKRSRSSSGGESKALHPSSEPGYKAQYRSSVHRISVCARSEVEASKISRYPCHLARQLRDFWARGSNFCQPWVGMLIFSIHMPRALSPASRHESWKEPDPKVNSSWTSCWLCSLIYAVNNPSWVFSLSEKWGQNPHLTQHFLS